MGNDPNEIKALFETIVLDDDGTFKKWLAYTYKLLAGYGLLHLYSPQEIVNTVYLKIVENARIWDRTKFPDIRRFFFVVIKSHIGNLAKKEREKVEFDEEFHKPAIETDCDYEGTRNFNEFLTIALEKLDHDKQEDKIFLCFLDNMQNLEIAEHLTISVHDVENAKKRIQRKLIPLYEKYYPLCSIRKKEQRLNLVRSGGND